MTIYIAGPMSGLPDYNRPAFHAKADELRAKGWRVLNPADLPLLDYDLYYPINKAMLGGADAVYMLNGWQHSTGANMEMSYAGKLGIPCYFEGDVL